METPKFVFLFYRFVGNGIRTTEIVRDFALADGMRSLVERSPETVKLANHKVAEWADTKGLSITSMEPFPSEKYPVYRFRPCRTNNGKKLRDGFRIFFG